MFGQPGLAQTFQNALNPSQVGEAITAVEGKVVRGGHPSNRRRAARCEVASQSPREINGQAEADGERGDTDLQGAGRRVRLPGIHTFGRMFFGVDRPSSYRLPAIQEKHSALVEKVHALTDRSGTWQETTTLVSKVNRTLRGWTN